MSLMRHRLRPGILFGLLLGALLGSLPRSAEAQRVAFPAKPAPGRFSVDEAGLIAPAEAQAINPIADALLRETGLPLIVVTIPSLAAHHAAGYTIEQYAFALFNTWGIGSVDRNYGMLLLVSKGDRRARIELGAAWGHGHDAQAQWVMDTLIIPEFKEGKFSEGILAGVRGLDAMARGLPLPKAKRWPSFARMWREWGWMVAVLVMAVLLRFHRSRSPIQGGAYYRDYYYYYDRDRYDRDSSGGGSSGGGSSGGGGASGSW